MSVKKEVVVDIFNMTVVNQSVKQLIAYLSSVLAEGVDISALYIIEAHLTKMKAAMKPAALMLQLFSNIQIKKIITFSRDYYQKLKSRESSLTSIDNHHLQDFDQFKMSLKDIDDSPVSQITNVSQQILETLEEWEQIGAKTQKLKNKLGTVTDYSCCLFSDQNLKQELDSLIHLVKTNIVDSQYKIVHESTSCISSYQDQEQLPAVRHLKIFQITSFFQYLLIWTQEIHQEISDFSALVGIVKQEFSLAPSQMLRKPKLVKNRTSFHNRNETNSGKAKIQTDRILSRKQNKEINTGQFQHSFPSIERVESLSSFGSKDPFLHVKTTKISSSIEFQKEWQRNKENSLPMKEQHCQRCQIY